MKFNNHQRFNCPKFSQFINIKIILSFGIFVTVVISYIYIFKGNNKYAPIKSDNIIKIKEKNFNISDIKSSDYYINWVIFNRNSDFILYSNTEDKYSTDQIKNNIGCIYIISSGFYNKNFEHIGLYKSINKLQIKRIIDDLINGDIFIDINNDIYIEFSGASDYQKYKYALQSGPILIKNNKNIPISSYSDDKSRRILLGKSMNGNIVFITIYSENRINGPTLKEIPLLVEKIEKETQLDFTDLINLDGGAHSAFITTDITLKELSTIGGYFCINPK